MDSLDADSNLDWDSDSENYSNLSSHHDLGSDSGSDSDDMVIDDDELDDLINEPVVTSGQIQEALETCLADQARSSSGSSTGTAMSSTPFPGPPPPHPLPAHLPPQSENAWEFRAPKLLDAAIAARNDLDKIRNPGWKELLHKRAEISAWLCARLDMIYVFLVKYTDPTRPHFHGPGRWMAASLEAAKDFQKGPAQARQIPQWAHTFIETWELPHLKYRKQHVSAAIYNDDLADEIIIYLQSRGCYIFAKDVVDYTSRPDVKKRHGLKKGFSLTTAQLWLSLHGF